MRLVKRFQKLVKTGLLSNRNHLAQELRVFDRIAEYLDEPGAKRVTTDAVIAVFDRDRVIDHVRYRLS